MSETREQEHYYATASIGDRSPAPKLMAQSGICGFKFHTPEEDQDDSPWVCTRTEGHAPPHVAENLTRIVAIHLEEGTDD